MQKCFALVMRSGNLNQCSFRKKDGDYCLKHHGDKIGKRTRIDDYKRILEVLCVRPKTVTLQDYLDDKKLKKHRIIDVYHTLKVNDPNLNCNMWVPSKLRKRLIIFYDNFIKTRKHISAIIKIQRSFRQRRNLKLLIKHGPCFFEREMCNNDEDFYTLDTIKNIPKDYFFSFRDLNGFYYGFDIRSLNQLLNQNKSHNNTSHNNTDINLQKQIQNPYSTNKIKKDILLRIIKLIKTLETSGNNLKINSEQELTYQQELRQSIIKVFSLIDQLGYQTDIDWILNMSAQDLKSLYRLTEDIWNYRSELTSEYKKEIVPSEAINPLFHNSIQYVMDLYDYKKILDINLEVFERLVSESESIACRSLGALYVLTSLASISNSAADTYPDLVQLNDHED